MTLEEIAREARRHRWTHAQVLFLSDRIRNALVVLAGDRATSECRTEAATKLAATIRAIEDAERELLYVEGACAKR